MKTVIDKNRMDRHSIDKYKFKVLAMGSAAEHESAPKASVFASESAPEGEPKPVPARKTEPAVRESDAHSRDALVESLLKKADDMSSNVIKMQMKIEDMEAAHKAALEVERARAFEEGIAAGQQQAQNEGAALFQEMHARLAASVKTLEAQSAMFDTALEQIKSELLHAALDIAKEVIVLEVGERSGQVARKLAAELIAELQGAAEVTLKVNPADHGALSEAVGKLAHVHIVSDSAISRGGVVAISDSGNIDAEVMKRFERIKSAALS